MKELEEAIERIKQLIEDYRGMLPYRWIEMKPQMEALRLVVKAAEAFRKIALITEYMDFCLRNKTKPRKEGGVTKEPENEETRTLNLTLPKEAWNIIDSACREHNMTVEETLVVVVVSGFLNLEKFTRGGGCSDVKGTGKGD